MKRPSHDRANSSSAKSDITRSESSAHVSPHLIPLIPPTRDNRQQTESVHQIVVETPFTEPGRTTGQPGLPKITLNDQDSKRQSSIDAKKLFPAPLLILWKKGKGAIADSDQPKHVTNPMPTENYRSHRSLPRREPTRTMLAKASAALESRKTRSPFLTSWKIGTPSTTSSSEKLAQVDFSQSAAKPLGGTFNVLTRKSIDHLASPTSSILDMQQGSTPQNSPIESATYKVKRSASADTEEFLKIDISIRGK